MNSTKQEKGQELTGGSKLGQGRQQSPGNLVREKTVLWCFQKANSGMQFGVLANWAFHRQKDATDQSIVDLLYFSLLTFQGQESGWSLALSACLSFFFSLSLFSLSSPGWPGTQYTDKAGLVFPGILHPECMCLTLVGSPRQVSDHNAYPRSAASYSVRQDVKGSKGHGPVADWLGQTSQEPDEEDPCVHFPWPYNQWMADSAIGALRSIHGYSWEDCFGICTRGFSVTPWKAWPLDFSILGSLVY